MKKVVAALLAPLALASTYDEWDLPNYCMATDTMDKVAIPPLTSNRPMELVQAQVIARHGARAPYSRVFCWETAPSPVNAVWNCSTSSVWSGDIMANDANNRGFGRLYKKQYMDGGNVLSGTCAVGGLLPLGREQHRRVGELLRKAYIGEGPLKLFNSSNLNTLHKHEIYLRSDDQERTLGSGQALVDGLFPYDVTDDSDTEHMLTWMTADGATDYIDHKSDNSCPALPFILGQVQATPEWAALSRDVAPLQAEFERVVNGTFSWDTCLECLMIARCNDLALPPGMTQELFDGLIQHVQARKKLVLTFQGGRYAKVDMHHMWADVLQRIDKIIADPEHAPKLSITIGHDSTIMPMMALLLGDRWDGAWTTYAGTLVLELYKESKHPTNDASAAYAVRAVYNGQPLLLPFCSDYLCEWTVFNDTFAFAREWRPCAVPTTSMSAVPTDRRWKPHGLHWVASAVMFSGCVSMTVVMMRELRHRQEDPTTRYLLA
ncbi:hypothetical protein, variant [Aphanomyces astaci]|uniref:Histidine acid phosphatase n=1 Tax=Aphanomyces astaci TaxID=112090 RepID=W4FGD7_APHAT|nr:hypothetical protein, variant [Aphanomyces astaci]ETV65934.1 hypothetical protein, variant [Aphanomyces astaci]|eukprot:XP_009844588.1 hypothetical protein, variant [Aphanomyces astaci]